MASSKVGRRSLAYLTALMTVFALVIPYVGIANAAHGGADTATIDIDTISLTPETASMPPSGACVQFTAAATSGGQVAEGETIDITASISDDDGTTGATGELVDLQIAFCDPDAAGPGVSPTGGANILTDTDDDGNVESAATISAQCVSNVNGQCIFGLAVTDTGTGANQGGSGTVLAFADRNNNNTHDPATEAFDTATITVGSGQVGTVSCTPATQTRVEGGRAEFNCTVVNASNQPLAGIQITADVISGPNAEEITPFNCGTVTNAQGQTPTSPNTFNGTVAGATPGACGYNDAGANTANSPPGTDGVVFCVQTAAPAGGTSTPGCDPHELTAQGNASASVNWVGNANTVSCTPDGLQATPGTSVTGTCTALDVNGQPVPGVVITVTETGPGSLQNDVFNIGNQCAFVATDQNGQCTWKSQTSQNETGTQTVTGSMSGAGTNCTAGNPPTPNAGTNAVCTDPATINWQNVTPTTPTPTVHDRGVSINARHKCVRRRNGRCVRKKVKVSGNATSTTGTPQCTSNVPVEVSFAGGVVASGTTNSNGHYSFLLPHNHGKYSARLPQFPQQPTTFVCNEARASVVFRHS